MTSFQTVPRQCPDSDRRDNPIDARQTDLAMNVVFVQKFVPHYRLPFHEGIRDELKRRGIGYTLVYGPPDPFEGSKVKTVSPAWGERVKSRIFNARGRYLYWQGAHRYVAKGDLVVVEHAAKLLDNYVLYALHLLGRNGYAYFGHGENFQTQHELGISRAIKRRMLRRVTRWFAYTEVSRQSLIRQGVDDQRITVVNNTLHRPPPSETTPGLSVHSSPDGSAGDVSGRASGNRQRDPNRFLYIGGLYGDKRLDVLFEACAMVAQRSPEFRLDVVGDGPLASEVRQAAERHDWLTWHGALYGEERDAMFARASAILMPGLVGLVIVDAFLHRCPIITSMIGQHSPEIAYLDNEVNGLMDNSGGTVESYAALVERFLQEPDLADRLRDGCARSANEYTMENMIKRFCDGVELCVEQSAAG